MEYGTETSSRKTIPPCHKMSSYLGKEKKSPRVEKNNTSQQKVLTVIIVMITFSPCYLGLSLRMESRAGFEAFFSLGMLSLHCTASVPLLLLQSGPQSSCDLARSSMSHDHLGNQH